MSSKMQRKPRNTENRINFDPLQRPGLIERLQEFRAQHGNISEAKAVKMLVAAALKARGLGIS